MSAPGKGVAAALLGGALLVVGACTSAGRPLNAAPGIAPGSGAKITVTVENLEFLDVTVYSVAGGGRIRLGRVTGCSTGRFTIPRMQEVAPSLELVADPVGSTANLRSGPIAAFPGQHVHWRVSTVSAFMSLSVR